MTDIRKGDRVRVTFEAVLRDENSLYASFSDEPGGKWVGEVTIDLANIEKIEPPVEVFKPGDVVRQRNGYRHMYFIRPKGFANLTSGREYDYQYEFTSALYEKIDLSAVTR